MERVPDLLLFTKCKDFLYYRHSNKVTFDPSLKLNRNNSSQPNSLPRYTYDDFPNYYQKAKTLLGSKYILKEQHNTCAGINMYQNIKMRKNTNHNWTQEYFRKPNTQIAYENLTYPNVYRKQPELGKILAEKSQKHCNQTVYTMETGKQDTYLLIGHQLQENFKRQMLNAQKVKLIKKMEEQKMIIDIKRNTMFIEDMKMKNKLSQIQLRMTSIYKNQEEKQNKINAIDLINDLLEIKEQNIEIRKQYVNRLTNIVNQCSIDVENIANQNSRNKIKIFETKLQNIK